MTTNVEIVLDNSFTGDLMGIRLCQQEKSLRASQKATFKCPSGSRRLTVRLISSNPGIAINFKLKLKNARWRGSSVLDDNLLHGEPSVYYIEVM